jgi:hypothetical protein
MTETDLTALRSAVASFDEDEKLAFAGILGLDCASSFGGLSSERVNHWVSWKR